MNRLNPEFTPIEALEAIEARIQGVWDNPQLERIGGLAPVFTADILHIIKCVPSYALEREVLERGTFN